jgi:hypothetical protein
MECSGGRGSSVDQGHGHTKEHEHKGRNDGDHLERFVGQPVYFFRLHHRVVLFQFDLV